MDAKNQPGVHFLSGAEFRAWKHEAHKMAHFIS